MGSRLLQKLSEQNQNLGVQSFDSGPKKFQSTLPSTCYNHTVTRLHGYTVIGGCTGLLTCTTLYMTPLGGTGLLTCTTLPSTCYNHTVTRLRGYIVIGGCTGLLTCTTLYMTPLAHEGLTGLILRSTSGTWAVGIKLNHAPGA